MSVITPTKQSSYIATLPLDTIKSIKTSLKPAKDADKLTKLKFIEILEGYKELYQQRKDSIGFVRTQTDLCYFKRDNGFGLSDWEIRFAREKNLSRN
tara:strand:+ start:1500 stop:1790 length:291 start_codon:yes stop_codon:yes gene_type:complete